ncbi:MULTISPECIES: aldo/keto reductase [Enterococcus]|uniref:aldo/keto reductase n=1 Tax=Enterococcus TaxID=1350 RepID=UPI000ED0EED3|nr:MULTISPECIES: aldo/keto reductase [Enterococcus]HCM84687.1 aldo/keto reductase [Enterococcus sp.]
MEKVLLAGQRVSPIGLGTWQIGDHKKKRESELQALKIGVELGAQVIDTAEMYGEGKSEILVGEAIQSVKRENIFLISKVLPENSSKELLPQSLDQSLKRLNVDYLDMYLLHWQGDVSLEETAEAMQRMKQLGKIKSWGVSNIDYSDLQRLVESDYGKECAANQLKYNIVDRGIEFDVLPYMRINEIPLIAYSPILKGSLPDVNSERSVLKEIANNHRASVYQILLSWSIRDGRTIAIPKSSDTEHVRENIKALEIELAQEELIQLDHIFPKPITKTPLALW